MKPGEIFDDAKAAPSKGSLEAHRKTIELLREKGYTWRAIADFLVARGVPTDHTNIYRFMRRQSMTVPSAQAYKQALSHIPITVKQRLMLKAHFESPNRSITYTALAASAGYSDYEVANRQYGQLGKDLGEAVSFEFIDAGSRPGKFYSSSIGMPNAYTSGDFQLVMHHELAKAIEDLKWFS